MEFAKHVQIREEKFGVVIFDTLKEKVFVTNKQGAEILQLVKDSKSQEEIFKALIDGYSGNRETIIGDATSFINHLIENNLLTKDK